MPPSSYCHISSVCLGIVESERQGDDMATSLGYGGYREPLCGNCPENSQQQFNQTMTALVHKNYALWTGNAARIYRQ